MDREVLHGWVMPMVLSVEKILPISCLDPGKIMVRLFSLCNTVVVCNSYGLIGSLVILNDCGTCALTFRSCMIVGLTHLQNWPYMIIRLTHESLNCQKMVCVCFWLHIHPSTDDQSRATKQEQANLCAVTVLCAST